MAAETEVPFIDLVQIVASNVGDDETVATVIEDLGITPQRYSDAVQALVIAQMMTGRYRLHAEAQRLVISIHAAVDHAHSLNRADIKNYAETRTAEAEGMAAMHSEAVDLWCAAELRLKAAAGYVRALYLSSELEQKPAQAMLTLLGDPDDIDATDAI